VALEDEAARAFGVLDPVLLTITNWPEGKVEEFEAEVHPKRPELGTRKIPFSG
jgi:glutaminyl-tRNA synthetase